MRRSVVGILAHVDAGKTTLSEALLFRSGTLRAMGRVDHGDAFLDTDALERERGITIFSKCARFTFEDWEAVLLDTPGHVDFSAETERVLRVLDCAIVLISGTDGVQSHTRTLWNLLSRHKVPAFLFVNKMDLDGADRDRVLEDLKAGLSGSIVDFGGPPEAVAEEAALCEEGVLERYLDSGTVSEADLRRLIGERKLFPCFFGSALKLDGVDPFLSALARYAPSPAYGPEFGARIFKITRDPQGKRLTWLKVTGGVLRAKQTLSHGDPQVKSGWAEKADQLRLYSGKKYQPIETAEAGTICAVTGLRQSRVGEGLGFERDDPGPSLEPVLSYRVLPLDGTDPHTALEALRQLEEEDPQLHVVWDEGSHALHVRLMGEIQLEVLRRVLRDRFGMDAAFGDAAIVYRETIAAPAVGVGHFEPLRHYAEVHLLLEPLPTGSGLQLASRCPEDALDRNWQRLILTHLAEREHPGVLTGSPITDLRITLTAGRAHLKHTEGGDFREATYRAVRQGLMGAECVLLEPWYAFRLELPASCVGRAITDLQRMGGDFRPPETEGETVVLTGSAPVSGMKEYAAEVRAYSRGLGQLSLGVSGFRPCPDQEAVVASIGYDPERDIANPTGSVFCAHGAGYVVPWFQVPDLAHIPVEARPKERQEAAAPSRSGSSPKPVDFAGTLAQEKELKAIFERTYGPAKERREVQVRQPEPPAPVQSAKLPEGPEYLLVDGYNIIYAWEELSAVARENLDAARTLLCDLLCEYQGMRGCVVIVVFDAYKVRGNPGSHEKYHNIHVVYTKEAETADAYIERATYEIGRGHRIRVATSDGPEQLIILGHGALRLPASLFREEMEQVQGRIAQILSALNRRENTGAVRAAIERALSQRNQSGA